MAVLAVEAAQFLLVAGVAWLVSAATLAASPPAYLAMAPPPLRPAAARVLSAGAVGLHSRGATRPLRLAVQLLLGDRLAGQLAARAAPPRRRAARRAAVAALALPLLAGRGIVSSRWEAHGTSPPPMPPPSLSLSVSLFGAQAWPRC